jgi:sulfate transport system permease protein
VKPPRRRDLHLARHAVVTTVLLLVVLPLVALVHHSISGGFATFWADIGDPVAVHALWLTILLAAVTATINAVAGTGIAWLLVRHEFWGRRALSAAVDAPFAVPTLVTGVLLVALYGPQSSFGAWLIANDIPIAFARPGIVLAMLFVTVPLAVRTVEPVLAELDPDEEDAARTLGAKPWPVFRRVLLPPLVPAIAAAWIQVFARSIAEFGSIAAVSGNMPKDTLVASVYVLGELEGGSSRSAAAVSVVLLFAALCLQPLAQRLSSRAVHGG